MSVLRAGQRLGVEAEPIAEALEDALLAAQHVDLGLHERGSARGRGERVGASRISSGGAGRPLVSWLRRSWSWARLASWRSASLWRLLDQQLDLLELRLPGA